jgi:hypothetical protein
VGVAVKHRHISNYTYLKLKMLGPHGVITMGSSFQRAYQCEVESCELFSAVIASEEIVVILEETAEEAPDSKRNTGSFEPTEGVKRSSLTPTTRGTKRCGSAQCSPPNRKVHLSTSSVPIKTSLHGNPRI